MDSSLGSPGLGGFGLRHRAVDKENNGGGGNVLHADQRGAAAVKKPPRASLARLGLSSPAASRPGPSREPGGNPTAGAPGGPVTAAITRRNDQQSTRATADDLSHWVVAYGFRTQAQHAALVRRMESCGDVTARRGGGTGDNWMALRFESRLSAHKALCADGALICAGGGQMVVGVAPLDGLATDLGLDLSVGPEEAERERRKSLARRHDELSASREEDLLLLADQDESQGKGICGRVLSWFFMWDGP